VARFKAMMKCERSHLERRSKGDPRVISQGSAAFRR
jgi:hypothetical protein